MHDNYNDDEQYFEPSLADEILEKYSNEMKEVLINSVKQEMMSLKTENENLKNKNKALMENQFRIESLERSVKQEKKDLLWTVKKERLSELMKDFRVVLYKAKNIGKEREKCNKCDENRKIGFVSPLGTKCSEICDCAQKDMFYGAQEFFCSEFSLGRDKGKLVMWYKEHAEEDCNDYYSYSSSNVAETLYNESMDYKDLVSYKTYFSDKNECLKYCDYLNKAICESK